jgi:hypothetical protein
MSIIRDFRVIPGQNLLLGNEEEGVLAEPIDAEVCGNCVFFNSEMGHCRRYPMSVEKYPHEWCGEFEMKVLQ